MEIGGFANNIISLVVWNEPNVKLDEVYSPIRDIQSISDDFLCWTTQSPTIPLLGIRGVVVVRSTLICTVL